MRQYTAQSEISNRLFKTPFETNLDQKNRWVVLRDKLPWDEMVKPLYGKMSDKGRRTIDLRYVLGALIIQSMENLTDEATISSIQENIYMQYFIGLPSFSTAEVFTPELFVTIRKRLGDKGVRQINDSLLRFLHDTGKIKHRKAYVKHSDDQKKKDDIDKDDNFQQGQPAVNRGTLKVDATVAPQWVKFPIDSDLLNDCRKSSEQIIDLLWEEKCCGSVKPRTYRRNLAKKILNFKKTKKPSGSKIRKINQALLSCLSRNLAHIEKGLDGHLLGLAVLSKTQYHEFLVIQCVYAQQLEMYKYKKNHVADRIVSFHQPWVRPMVRGKAGRKTEFGAQINISESEGYVTFDQVNFNKFNEALWLEDQIEGYKQLYGHYPAAVLADKIYLTRKNRKFMKDKGILHYGAPLGRPSKISKKEKLNRAKKQNKRSIIEGKIGQAKTKFGLDQIKTRLLVTNMAKIHLVALGLNIWKYLQYLRTALDSFLNQLRTYMTLYISDTSQYLNITIGQNLILT